MNKFSGNIYLVGLMGAGKTTVGRSLAKRLGLRFVDTDKEIELRTGVSIPTIFELEGNEGFRKREARILAETVAEKDCVVATGGGSVLCEENRASMRKSGFVIYLNVSPPLLWERTRHDRNRPLLQVEDPLLKLHQLFDERDPLYRSVANLVVDEEKMSPQNLLPYLLKELENRWKH